MNEIGSYIFDEDSLEFEPYKTFKKNYIYWFKTYMKNIFNHQSTRTVKDKRIHSVLIQDFNSKKSLDEMRETINAMARNGFKAPKTYFNPNVMFYNFLIHHKIPSLGKINSSSLKFFLANELEEYSYGHKKNIYVAIKNFLYFIEEKNYKKDGDNHSFKLSKNIIRVINREKKSLAYLSPHDEYYSFLETIDKINWRKSVVNRNRLMLKVLLITGIRVGELTNIKFDDIIIENNSYAIQLIGKGNKKRTVYISKKIAKNDYEVILANRNSDYLFSTSNSQKVNDRYLNTIILKVMKDANIPLKDKNGPHMLRHSCCSWLSVVAGLDIAKLQAYMAHEDISTTRKYTHISNEVVKDISQKANEILGKELEVIKYE